jgi:hypothetical protein
MTKINHIMDITRAFGSIITKIHSIKQNTVKNSNFDIESQDARLVALDSIQSDMLAVGNWISTLNSLANKCVANGKLNEKEFLESVGSIKSLKDTEDIMYKFLRLGLLAPIHFKIDNMFHNILRELGNIPKDKKGSEKKSFWDLTEVISSEASLSKDEKESLIAFSYLRNSLHNNGMHRYGNNLNINIRGLDFKFKKDKKIECASWEHIIIVLDVNIDVINKILSSPKIYNLKDEIKDDFASLPRI